RADNRHAAARLFERLESSLGKGKVFMDVETIDPGQDFREAIQQAVRECEALLAVIGDSWLSATDEHGKVRLSQKNDFVRLEIEAALTRGVLVIPVLVGSAPMPTAAQLPRSLKRLAFCQGVVVRPDPHFHADVDYLIRHLDSVPELGPDDVGLFDFLMNQIDWEAME